MKFLDGDNVGSSKRQSIRGGVLEKKRAKRQFKGLKIPCLPKRELKIQQHSPIMDDKNEWANRITLKKS